MTGLTISVEENPLPADLNVIENALVVHKVDMKRLGCAVWCEEALCASVPPRENVGLRPGSSRA